MAGHALEILHLAAQVFQQYLAARFAWAFADFLQEFSQPGQEIRCQRKELAHLASNLHARAGRRRFPERPGRPGAESGGKF